MSDEVRKLFSELQKLVSGHKLGVAREATVNLLAVLAITEADTQEQFERTLDDTRLALTHVAREHWNQVRRDITGKG